MQFSDETVGTLTVIRRTGKPPFNTQETATTEVMATQILLAIDRQILIAETKRSLEETTALFDVAVNLMATTEPIQVLQSIADACRRVVGADRVTVRLTDPSSQQTTEQVVSPQQSASPNEQSDSQADKSPGHGSAQAPGGDHSAQLGLSPGTRVGMYPSRAPTSGR